MTDILRVRDLPSLPVRKTDAHKGDFGRTLVVAGSRGMAGAAGLAGLGALRGGAGLVTVAVPEKIADIVASYEPSYLVRPLPCDEHGQLLLMAWDVINDEIEQYAAVACGPGWGKSVEIQQLAARMLRWCPVPLIVDADGLNALVGQTEAWLVDPDRPPRVITPHPGEFARLIGQTTAEVQARREELACQFAAEHQVVVVLKGAHTVITDGQRVAINTTGNSGMATGGTGDVLTGLIAALLAQGMPAFEASQLAAFVHGRAGDRVAGESSGPGLIASDLPRAIAQVWHEMGR